MVDIGFLELMVVAIVALLVLGPERLPIAARTCGLWLGRIRRTVGTIQREIDQELQLDELQQATAAQRRRAAPSHPQAATGRPRGGDEADDAPRTASDKGTA